VISGETLCVRETALAPYQAGKRKQEKKDDKSQAASSLLPRNHVWENKHTICLRGELEETASLEKPLFHIMEEQSDSLLYLEKRGLYSRPKRSGEFLGQFQQFR
jgi:hypothetical protein